MSSAKKNIPDELITTVFVGNLAWTTTDADLKIFCSSVGKIVSSEIKRFPDTSRSKGWGLVTYETPAAAALAVERLNMTEFMSRVIHVRFDREEIDEADDPNAIKVFVGNIPWEVSEAGVMDHFRGYPPKKLRMMTNMSGRSRGFALLQYNTMTEAENAIRALNESTLGGRQIQCRVDRGPGREVPPKTQPRLMHIPQISPVTQLFVRNISPLCNDDTLAAIFSRYGAIANSKIMIHPNGSPKGWGVVSFFNSSDAIRAAEMTNGHPMFEDMPPLEVRLDRKSPRRGM